MMEMYIPFLALYANDLAEISLYTLLGLLDIREHKFDKLAACPKCASLKALDQVVLDPICRNIRFNSTCNTSMVTETRLLSGKVKPVPKIIIAYNSVIKQLQHFMLRPGFMKKLELWRKRVIPANVIADVFDGRVWRDFQSYKNKPFLSKPNNLMFQLNNDGFEPWERRVYSVVAIYLTCLNLPRSERFKKENCILIALIPPHCKGTTSLDAYLRIRSMNPLLEPLIDELLILLDVIHLRTYGGSKVKVRAFLVGVACDLSAIRKICGFMPWGCPRL